ncbi:hypothetical protein BV898_07311 [Hypsibius exemplaris]|uniref:Secreted protein n=1 Tax=Hypsibius exemplaris TaxID=2072580 RepID=A0A1W0WU08_HYPEX|nr:hypothetical protein BV898_07311 [Hypsibius exemplaris]
MFVLFAGFGVWMLFFTQAKSSAVGTSSCGSASLPRAGHLPVPLQHRILRPPQLSAHVGEQVPRPDHFRALGTATSFSRCSIGTGVLV